MRIYVFDDLTKMYLADGQPLDMIGKREVDINKWFCLDIAQGQTHPTVKEPDACWLARW